MFDQRYGTPQRNYATKYHPPKRGAWVLAMAVAIWSVLATLAMGAGL